MSAEYTLNEVARHCTADDLWIVYKGGVYDITSYFDSHPGGVAMLRQAGKDASVALPLVQMHTFAWSAITKTLEKHRIGTLKE
ncbi:Cytochrome b5 heme-binding domain-containing protein [Trichostrongylus colubriformis]|uniref:Cytochrome b5 heme-binding domain-containing protein n=1 Tax=Trichostrongylus colubriformis TaxID=6319 RepID=A0AAN8ITR5_TRICO